MGLEVLEQVPDIDAAIIPVGGGGLIAGCAVALKTMKPDIQIIVSFIGYCRFSGYPSKLSFWSFEVNIHFLRNLSVPNNFYYVFPLRFYELYD